VTANNFRQSAAAHKSWWHRPEKCFVSTATNRTVGRQTDSWTTPAHHAP